MLECALAWDMRILVTGARGKVGAATVAALHDAGHEVTASDLRARSSRRQQRARRLRPGRPHRRRRRVRGRPRPRRGRPRRRDPRADPEPAAHRVPNNLMATFNTLEAAVRWGVAARSSTSPRRPSRASSFAERPFLPDYVPVDEEHPIRPQDPYATAKHFGELLMDGATRRSDLTGVSIRPSWVQWEGNYAANLGPWIREPSPSEGFWAYIDAYDLADAIRLAAEADHARPRGRLHRVARQRRARAARGPRPPLPRRRAPELRAVRRAEARRDLDRQGAPAARLGPAALVARLPRRRGRLRPEARERLERGETGVQRGRAAQRRGAVRARRGGAATKPRALRRSSRQRGPSSPRPDVSKRRPAIDHVGVPAVGVDGDPRAPPRSP